MHLNYGGSISLCEYSRRWSSLATRTSRSLGNGEGSDKEAFKMLAVDKMASYGNNYVLAGEAEKLRYIIDINGTL